MSEFQTVIAAAYGRHSARRIIGGAFGRLSLWKLLAAAVLVWSAGPLAASSRHIAQGKSVAPPMGATALCRQMSWACAGGTSGQAGNLLKIATQVNARVNRSVREVTDQRQYRREEHWALPTRRGGDCEDFALAKKRELMRMGVAPSRLLIATVLDRRLEPHAVLVVRTDSGDYVLDNLRREVLHWADTGYTYLRMQDPENPRGWMAVLAGGVLAS